MSFRTTLENIVRRIVHELPYLRSYQATVEKQHDDYTVDVTPDDESIRGNGLIGLPIRHGIPGVRVRVASGARVMLRFADGDPRKPYVALWDEGSVESIEFAGGSRAVARVGDLVQVNWPVLSAIGTLNSAPFAASIAAASVSTGVVSTGSDKVTSG